MFKKVFAAMLAGLFISAPAFAEVKMNGSFFIKGNYTDQAGKDSRAYESDFELKTNFIVDENTSAKLVVEAFDTAWLGNDEVGGGEANSDSQNYLEVSQATMTHKFTETNTIFTGGVDGNGENWGSAFNDNATRGYFLQAEQILPFGTLTLKTEKMDENDTREDGDDKDAFLVGLTTEVAGFTVKPALYMVKDQEPADETTDTRAIVYASGKVAAVSIESEVVYADNESDDSKTFGVYVNANTTVAGFGLNAAGIYASADDAVGFGVSDELAIMEIVTDDIKIDGTNLLKVGISKGLTEKVSTDAALAFISDNKDNSEQDGYEANANAYYKASDAVTLSLGVAYLDLDSLSDARTDAYAKINVAF